MSRRVIKVGGSLFDWPELPQRLGSWLQAQSPSENYLIAGGGELCDAIRRYDLVLKLGDQVSHELCMELLGVSAKLLQVVLAQASEQVGGITQPMTVVDVNGFFTASSLVFPHTWAVTSDSLAALIAVEMKAEELVLLKSSIPATFGSRAAAAEAGFVDSYFPTAAAHLPRVRVVNLRDSSACEWWLS